MDVDTNPQIYLHKLSECVSKICPPISKYLKFKSIKEERVDTAHQSKSTVKLKKCSACVNQFNSANHHIRLLPRQPMKRKLQKLLKKFSENPTSLSVYHRNYINNYLHSKNCIVITCHVCSKTTKVPCQSRPERSVQLQRQQELIPCETTAPKTRKCKRKEKKKLRKRQRKEMEEDTSIMVKDSSNTMSSESEISQLSSPGEIKLSLTTISSTPKKRSKDNTSTPNIKQDSSPSRNTLVTSLLNVKMNSQRQNENRPGKRTRSKDRHQLLTKMLAQEKKNKSLPDSLSAFLSSV